VFVERVFEGYDNYMQIAPLSQNVFGNFADVDAIQCSINFIVQNKFKRSRIVAKRKGKI
jgi:hypothetical protein